MIIAGLVASTFIVSSLAIGQSFIEFILIVTVALDEHEVDGSGSGKGTYGWSGYHNTHFWIDPLNKTYGLFMSRAIEFDFSIKKRFKQAFYLND